MKQFIGGLLSSSQSRSAWAFCSRASKGCPGGCAGMVMVVGAAHSFPSNIDHPGERAEHWEGVSKSPRPSSPSRLLPHSHTTSMCWQSHTIAALDIKPANCAKQNRLSETRTGNPSGGQCLLDHNQMIMINKFVYGVQTRSFKESYNAS